MRALLLTFLASLLCVPASGQTLWSRPYEPNQLAVEAIVPDRPSGAGPLTGATFITGTVSVTDNAELIAEVPVARFQPTSGGSSTALGNPFVGLGLSSTTAPVLLQVGVRIPAAPDGRAASVGRTTDVGRTPAFHPEEFGLSGLLNSRLEVGRYTTLRLRTGLAFGSRPGPTGTSRERSWRMPYEAQLWREGDRLLTGLTLAGQALLTSPGTTQHHAALSVMANWNLVQPGLLAGTSLNPLFRTGTFVPFAGVTLSISYGRL